MAQKLTITIPDEVALELEPFREQINISTICAEAIRREIVARNVSAKVVDVTLERVAARLRAERLAS